MEAGHFTNRYLKDEKACFSRIGRPYKHDYTVTFEDSQRVQNIREQLLRTIVVLDAHLEVVKGCNMHCRTLDATSQRCLSHDLVAALDGYSSDLRNHRSATHAALERSQGTLSLVSEALTQVLSHHNANLCASYSRSWICATMKGLRRAVLRCTKTLRR